jgi:hypothetical protein
LRPRITSTSAANVRTEFQRQTARTWDMTGSFLACPEQCWLTWASGKENLVIHVTYKFSRLFGVKFCSGSFEDGLYRAEHHVTAEVSAFFLHIQKVPDLNLGCDYVIFRVPSSQMTG